MVGTAVFVAGAVQTLGDETIIQGGVDPEPQVAETCRHRAELPAKLRHRDRSYDVLEQNRSPVTSYPCRTSRVVAGRTPAVDGNVEIAHRAVSAP